MGDNFGKIFSLTSWGESHGRALGVVIEGCPAGLCLAEADIQIELNRRRPGQSDLTTARKEQDRVEIVSGVFEGRTLGTALALLVRNEDAHPQDYQAFKDIYRPSHADFSYEKKYGGMRNWQGGGRASARETVGRVAAGAVAKKLLSLGGVETLAWVSEVHHLKSRVDTQRVTREQIEGNPLRCPDSEAAQAMTAHIVETKKQGDSVGGVIDAVVRKCPAGLGEPVFDKLTADLAKALMSLPATRGVEFGLGFGATALFGSEHNDAYRAGKEITKASNRAGGIEGGISNGEPILLRVAFKPTATIAKVQHSVNREGKQVLLKGHGRHDPCVLPRAVPLVEAMINLVLIDHWLRQEPQWAFERLLEKEQNKDS